MQPTRTTLYIVIAIMFVCSGLCLFYKNKNNHYVNLLNAAVWFTLGCIGTYVFTSKQKNHEGRYVSNIIIVQNTSTCNNVCYHIHHWLWMLVALILFIVVNKFIINDKCSHMDYTNVLALYFGASISEYIKYGSDIFIIKQKCFSDCLLKRR
jgi:hypothetical protein